MLAGDHDQGGHYNVHIGVNRKEIYRPTLNMLIDAVKKECRE